MFLVVLFLCLCCWGVLAENNSSAEPYSPSLVGGPNRCQGELQIYWNQSWTRVCQGALDQQGAEVLCRELGCGAPSLLQGALSPLGQMFHCEGHESALRNCSHFSLKTCSSQDGVTVTCSEPLRLVGGAGRCAGTVEIKQSGEWRRVHVAFGFWEPWGREATAAVCRDLDCGFPLYEKHRDGFPLLPGWKISLNCLKKSTVRECGWTHYASSWGVEMNCSESVRLVSGFGVCSGSLQIHLNQSWTRVCQGALDQQGAEVLCRELGCGAPSLLQGTLSPLGQTFHCEGHETSLMDCPRSSLETCSSRNAVHVTCSEPLRLVGGASRCAGTVEVKHRGEWRRVYVASGPWTLEHTAAVCRNLDCGSAVHGEDGRDFPRRRLWVFAPDCVQRSAVRECVYDGNISLRAVDVVCSDLLNRPVISLSVTDGFSEARPQGLRVLLGSNFRVICSVEPQYPGGFFQLLSPTVPAQNHTLPASNHSAHFLFSDAGHAHKGNYTCIYHLQMFNHSFSSQSPTLQLSLGESDSALIIRVLVILLLKLLYILPMCYYYYKVRDAARQRSQL